MDRSRLLGNSVSALRLKWRRSSRLQKIASATVVASMLLAQIASVTLPAVEAQAAPIGEGEIRRQSPFGYLDGVTDDCEYITGWACDASDYSKPTDVHIYQDGLYGQPGSKFLTKDWAKEPVPAGSPMIALCGGTNMHRFRIPVPNSIKDGQRHALYAYGINFGIGRNLPLRDGPVYLKCNGNGGGNNGGGGGGNVNLDIENSGPSQVDQGGEVVYHMTITNKGDKKTETARVLNYFVRNNERVLRPLTFLPNRTEGGATCNYSATDPDRAIECDVLDIAPGQTRNIDLHFRVEQNANCGALITNHAAVKNGKGEDVPVHDFSRVETTVKCDHGGNNGGGGGNENLDIEGDEKPDALRPGKEVIYSFFVTNRGNGVAQNVRLVDYFLRQNPTPGRGVENRILPPLEYLPGRAPGSDCYYDNKNPDRAFVCTTPNLQPGQKATVRLVFRVPNDINCNGNVTNIAAIKVGTEESQDHVRIDTPVKCDNGGSSSSVDNDANNPIGHFGGTNEQGIKLYGWTCDPDNFAKAIDVHIYEGGRASDPGAQRIAVGTANFTGETAVAQKCGGFNAHRFYIDAPQSIKDGKVHQLYAHAINIGPGHNVLLNGSPYQYRFTGGSSSSSSSSSFSSSSSSSSQGGNAVLTVDKTTNQSTVRHGEAIFYTITVRNVGNATANNVEVYDNVPFGLNYQPAGSSNGCNLQTVNGVQQVRCQGFNLAAGSAQTFTLKFMVTPGILNCGATIRNQADVEASNAALQWDDVFSTVDCSGGGSSNSSSSSSSSSSTGFCNGSTDLIIQKTGQATVTPGGQIVYTITVTNVSNCDAQQVVVNDQIPGNTFFLTSSGASCTQNTGSNVACTLGTIHAGQQRTFTVTFQTYNNVSCNNTIIYNTATVSTTTNESNGGNNQSQTVQTAVNCGGNSSSSSSFGSGDFYVNITDGESEVEQGDDVEYVLTVRNNQNQTVNNVTATVNLDSDVDYDSCSDNCSQNGRTVTWNNLSFGAGESRTFRIDAEVEDDADDELETTAYVGNASDTDETDVEDDDDVDSDDDDDDVRIELNIETSAGEVLPGGIIYYTVRVRNTGNVDIRDTVNVTINLPSGVTVIDNGGASYFGNELRWEIDGINEGDSWTKTFRVSVNSNQTPGTVLYTNVRAFGGGIDESRSVSVNVIGSLPQTGFMTGCASGQCLKLSSINGGAGTPSAPLAVMLSLMGIGAGAGIGFGRRLFFV